MDVSRREFVKICSAVGAALALPAGVVAEALASPDRPSLIHLSFQACGGNSSSFKSALDLFARAKGPAIALVEGSIPTKPGYCLVDGRPALDVAREVCGSAAATIALGNCASFGGLAAAHPNPTGAVGVAEAVPHARNVINLPGCPANPENVTAVIVHYLTFGRWPDLDAQRRPLFAYGKLIHDACDRRAHYDAGQYVEQWGDDGHRAGYCLYKLGCKGPVTSNNCPNVRWNGGANWPVAAGHPCLGCAEAKFWDAHTPFYEHLPGGVHASVDTIGAGAAGLVAAGVAVRGVVNAVRRMKANDDADRD
jgi:hydrogenase small subunit